MLRGIATFAAVVSLGAVSASAVEIVNESFDLGTYTAGSDLAGQNGWAGDPGYSSGNITVQATGLTHPGVLGASGGSSAGLNTAFASSGNQGVVAGPTYGADTLTSEDLWFSALMSLEGNGGSAEANTIRLKIDSDVDPFVFGLYSGGNGGTTSEYDLVFGRQATDAAGSGFISSAGFSGTQYQGGTTALIVGRVDTSAGTGGGTNETVDFWLNPTDFASEATLTSSAQGTMSSSAYSLLFGAWGEVTLGAEYLGSVTGSGYQDEIRVATSLEELNLAVPEPTSLTLAGAGLLVIFARRRKHHTAA